MPAPSLLAGCLVCGTSGAFDCEKCCSGCSLVSKGTYKYCECSGPKPGPPPTPSPTPGAQWDTYVAGGMDVISVTGGTTHEKVVVMLHGGGASGSEWVYNFQQGWFGNLSGLKYVFPTSPLTGHVWFNTFKNGCGLDADCAYDIPSIREAATHVAALLDHEKSLVGGDATKVLPPRPSRPHSSESAPATKSESAPESESGTCRNRPLARAAHSHT